MITFLDEVSILFVMVLGIELRDLCLPGKRSTTELCIHTMYCAISNSFQICT